MSGQQKGWSYLQPLFGVRELATPAVARILPSAPVAANEAPREVVQVAVIDAMLRATSVAYLVVKRVIGSGCLSSFSSGSDGFLLATALAHGAENGPKKLQIHPNNISACASLTTCLPPFPALALIDFALPQYRAMTRERTVLSSNGLHTRASAPEARYALLTPRPQACSGTEEAHVGTGVSKAAWKATAGSSRARKGATFPNVRPCSFTPLSELHPIYGTSLRQESATFRDWTSTVARIRHALEPSGGVDARYPKKRPHHVRDAAQSQLGKHSRLA